MRLKQARVVMDKLAEQTWHMLARCHSLEIRLDEDAITTHLLVAIATQLNAVLWMRDGRSHESHTGCDFELWVAAGTGWRRYAVQAKRISLPSFRYRKLKHSVGPSATRQDVVLEAYASAKRADPVYLFYNYWDPSAGASIPGAASAPTQAKFGCTVTPLATAREAMLTRGARNYPWIHSQPGTNTWSYLLLPRIGGAKGPTISGELYTYLFGNYHEQLPHGLDPGDNGPRIRPMPKLDSGDDEQPRAVIVIGPDTL